MLVERRLWKLSRWGSGTQKRGSNSWRVCSLSPAWGLKLVEWKEGTPRTEAWNLPGVPWWHLDDLPRLAGTVAIPEPSSESLPKRVRMDRCGAPGPALLGHAFREP